MAPPSRWSREDITALRALLPGDRAAYARFAREHPHLSSSAIASKLATLRRRGQAADVDHKPRGSPFPHPRYRFD